MGIASSAMQFLFASLSGAQAHLSLVVSRKDPKVGLSLGTRGTEQHSPNRPNTMVVRIQVGLKVEISCGTDPQRIRQPISVPPSSSRSLTRLHCSFPKAGLRANVKPLLPPFHPPTLHCGTATVKTAQLILA